MSGWKTKVGGLGSEESPDYIALANAKGELRYVTGLGGPFGWPTVAAYFAAMRMAEERKGEKA